MTPTQKANHLIGRFIAQIDNECQGQIFKAAKQCALIAVDEMKNELDQLRKPEYTTFVTDYDKAETMDGYEKLAFLEEVKEEIENYRDK